jgi:BASS family bile acid:Na+ symporter
MHAVMMTSASTLMAVLMTPLLSTLLIGQLIPIDAQAMFLDVLKLVLVPVLAGCTLNTFIPGVVSGCGCTYVCAGRH